MTTIGVPPGTGPALQDGTWLNALANGQNLSYESGLTASGTTQSNGSTIPPNIYLVEFDTVSASDDTAVLPFALAGTEIAILNNAASNAMLVFANPGTNPVTNAADKLNGSTSNSVTINAGSVSWFCCAKNGVWVGK